MGEPVMRFHSYNKDRNKPTFVDGKRFASKKEAQRYSDLRLLEIAGEISKLKCQVKFPLWVEGELVCTYIADFSYLENGVYKVEDVKGVKTPAYKIKKNLMWALNHIAIRET
jgi:hypothetical protein